MITAFRRYLETWVVRAFFLLMVVAFIVWGVGDVVRMIGTNATWVAKVGDQTIEGTLFQGEYQRALNQATRDLPSGQEASADLRRQVGDETLNRLVSQAALAQELHQLRIVTPDAALRETITAMPAFRDQSGRFNRGVFEGTLRNNGLTEPRFLDMMRADLAQRQLLEAISAGAAAPRAEAVPLYKEQYEKRSADIVEFPFAAQPAPPAPTDADLQRWYDNHPDRYSTPELRKVKAIILSPQTLAKDIDITDADLRDAYNQRKADYVTLEKRSAQVISVSDQAKAQALATQWRGGAEWDAMQKAAEQAGGSAVQLDDSTEQAFPDPDLAKAVFAAAQESVAEPVKGALGWYVVKVVKVDAGTTKSFDDVKDELRKRVLVEKATDLMYERANKVDNLLGNGTALDQMPADLGLAGVTGTLDAEGNTSEGTQAPIPGPPELRKALIDAAFKAQKGDPPQLSEVQTPSEGGSAYYAVAVEEVSPPAAKPFDQVKAQVEKDWTADQTRHEAETAAAKMLAGLKGGQSLADASAVAGAPVRRTAAVTRDATGDVPPELARVLFGLKQGEPTMVETADGFIVAEPATIEEPDPAADATRFQQLQGAVAHSIGNDLVATFTEALRQRANPRTNDANFDSIVQPR